MIPQFPPEIFYEIFGWLQQQKDSKSILSCSLVNRRFYYMCVPHLWRTRALYDNENIEFCMKYPELLHYVKDILITNGPEWESICALTKQTPNVDRFRVTRRFTNEEDYRSMQTIFATLPQLRSFHLDNSRFQFDPVELLSRILSASRDITSISMKNCDIHLLYRSSNNSTREESFKSRVKEFICDGTTSFTDSLLIELARAQMFTSLERLSVERTSISDWSMVNVIPLLSHLTCLNLVGTHITDETIDSLTSNMQMTLNLRELKLGTVDHPCIRVSPSKMHTLVMALQKVEVLYLNGCGVSRHITQHILTFRKNLKELDLGGSDIDQSIFDYLMWKKSSCVSSLKYLGLAGCRNLMLECDSGSRTTLSPFSRFVLASGLENLDCSGIIRIRFAYIYGFKSNQAKPGVRSKGLDICTFGPKELKRLRAHMVKKHQQK